MISQAYVYLPCTYHLTDHTVYSNKPSELIYLLSYGIIYSNFIQIHLIHDEISVHQSVHCVCLP